MWENITCLFGLPHSIVSDNRKHFANGLLKEWCHKLKIKKISVSVAHHQANRQLERANQSIVEGINNRLGRQKHSWLDELPDVLWAHWTMPEVGHGETHFSLTYGTEAMIHVEIGLPTNRTSMTEQENEKDLRLNLNLSEERREIATRRESEYKKKMENYYNSRVREVKFKVGDLVLRENEASMQEDQGKLGPWWEGPYQVLWAREKGSYKLEYHSGEEVPRTWNSMQLKKYYA